MVSIYILAQKMVTVMSNSDDQLIDKNSNQDKSKDQENRIEHDVKYIETNGYDYNNLYGLSAVPFLGIVLSVFTYLLRRYQTSSYASTKYSDKEIQTSLPSIDLEEKKIDSADVGSKETSIDEEDNIYLNIKESNLAESDKDPSFTRSGTQYK